MLLRVYLMIQDLKNNELGQDMIEYALVVALISLGATSAMRSFAGGINSAFNSVYVTFEENI